MDERQRVVNALIAPPSNPVTPNMQQLGNAARTAGNFAYDVGVQPFVDMGNAVGGFMQQGFGAPEIGPGVMGAMGMMSPGSRMAPRLAQALMAETGSGVGRGLGFRTTQQIDNDLERLLAGTDWAPMDISMRTPKQLKEFGLSDDVIALAKERDASVKAMHRETAQIDKRLGGLLKGTDITPMDVAMRGPEGMEKIKHLVPAGAWDEVMALAQKRRQFE